MRSGNRKYHMMMVMIAVAAALPIVMHVINGMNSRMLADDYCFAANVQNRGLAGAMTYYYTNWQGTFSSTAVQSAIALSGGWLVRWLPALIVVGWWLALVYLLWNLCDLLDFQTPRLATFTLATLLLYGILEGTPTVFQSIYWTSGSVTYSVPMVLFTLWGGVMLHLLRVRRNYWIILIGALITSIWAGLMAGFSPIFAVFEISVLGLVVVAIWISKPPTYRMICGVLVLALVGATVGMLIMVAAPGNSVRQALYHKPSSLLALIGINLVSVASYIGIDFSTFSLVPNLVLLVVGGWLISNGAAHNNRLLTQIKRTPRRWLLVVLAIAIVILFGVFLPTSYNISGFPPGRALIIPHVVTLELAVAWGSIMAMSMRKTSSESKRLPPVMIAIITGLLVIGPLWAAGKSASLASKLQTFASEWDERDTTIRNAANAHQSQVSVAPFQVDLADYVNVGTVEGEFRDCLAHYYHIETLTVKE